MLCMSIFKLDINDIGMTMKKNLLTILALLFSGSLLACNYDDCEIRCENKFIDGGVPLWTCAEKCAVCQG